MPTQEAFEAIQRLPIDELITLAARLDEQAEVVRGVIRVRRRQDSARRDDRQQGKGGRRQAEPAR